MRRLGMVALLVVGVGLGLTGCIVTDAPSITASAHPEGLAGRYNQVDDPGDDLIFSVATDPVTGIDGYRVDTVPTGTDTVKETQWLAVDDQSVGGKTLVQFRLGEDQTGFGYLAMERPDHDTLLFAMLVAGGLTGEALDSLRGHAVTVDGNKSEGADSVAHLTGKPDDIRAALRDLIGTMPTPEPVHLIRVGGGR